VDYSGPIAIKARALGQRLGVIRPMVSAYRKMFAKSYEERFHRALLDAIRPGDIVWDIGANVGVYTKLFAQRVGPTGRVVAFEPSPGPYAALAAAVERLPNVRLHNVALSQAPGRAAFYVGGDGSNTTDGLTPMSDQAEAIEVAVERADAFCAAGAPNVVKIDVEGFELEVLEGMSETLAATPALRALFVEVHFLTLASRGLRHAPARMIAYLRGAGFAVKWIDPSHFSATRRS
jgi:FkbM family methyltransferase